MDGLGGMGAWCKIACMLLFLKKYEHARLHVGDDPWASFGRRSVGAVEHTFGDDPCVVEHLVGDSTPAPSSTHNGDDPMATISG